MKEEFIEPFVKSVKDIIKKMANIEVKSDDKAYSESNEIKSKGVTSIINYSGKISGRIVLDMEKDLAIVLTKKITGASFNTANEKMVLSTVSELNNIIAGDGLTDINNKFMLGLRLLPPIVFTGDDTLICLEKIHSESVNLSSQYGNIRINIACEGSAEISG